MATEIMAALLKVRIKAIMARLRVATVLPRVATALRLVITARRKETMVLLLLRDLVHRLLTSLQRTAKARSLNTAIPVLDLLLLPLLNSLVTEPPKVIPSSIPTAQVNARLCLLGSTTLVRKENFVDASMTYKTYQIS